MLRVTVQPILRVLITRFPAGTSSTGPLAIVKTVSISTLRDQQTGLTSIHPYTTSQQSTGGSETSQTSQSGSGASAEARHRARMLTLATASATAALGSLYLLYRQTSVKADGTVVVQVREGGREREERGKRRRREGGRERGRRREGGGGGGREGGRHLVYSVHRRQGKDIHPEQSVYFQTALGGIQPTTHCVPGSLGG